MTTLHEQGALKQQFRTTLALDEFRSEADAVLSAVDTPHDAQIIEGQKRGIQVLMGMGDADDLGGALRGVDGVTAAKQNEARQKLKEKKDRDARRLQALLDDLAALDAKIDDLEGKIDGLDLKIDKLETLMQGLEGGSMSVDDVLADPVAADAVREWERKNGRKFDKDADNAADVLTSILGTYTGDLTDKRNGLQKDLDAARIERAKTADEILEIDKNYPVDREAAIAKTIEVASVSSGSASAAIELTTVDEVAEAASNIKDRQETDVQTEVFKKPDASFLPIGGRLGEIGIADPFQKSAALPVSAEDTPQPNDLQVSVISKLDAGFS